MSGFEVDKPILNSPYEEPKEYWNLIEGETPERLPGRRPAMYFYRPPTKESDRSGSGPGVAIELKLVNRIRQRLAEWRESGYPGVSRTSLELLKYWRREGRQHRLFFAQLEAAETVILLVEGRGDIRQGIEVPKDEPGEDGIGKGYSAFDRYACKMATGAGKTTVMAMLAAWSILNRIAGKADKRFSDTVLVVCPNVTIRNRLQELNPSHGEASLYRTRDLVPGHLMPDLCRGRVLVTNWHVFEPQAVQTAGVGSRVSRAGVEVRTQDTILIGPKNQTARGSRYLTKRDYDKQVALGMLRVISEEKDAQGNLKKAFVESRRYVESDAALVNRVLGRDVGGKKNILVFNDEAHHAYRIKRTVPDEDEADLFDEDEGEELDFFKEATVWVEGLDRINKLRGINFCIDLSATPYYLGRVGQSTNRTFPWVVSDFGLVDAIESGLVKIPQLAVRDSTGAEIPGYFNVWRYIQERLTPSEKGGTKGSPKPEAILKWANTPISMLGAYWDQLRLDWEIAKDDPRPPVFILVCKNTKISKVLYEWLAEDRPPTGIPSCGIAGFRNVGGRRYTIRVDTKVVHETDSEVSKNDESAWMRFTLDTVGKLKWPSDSQGRPLYPEGFEDLASKLERPLDPPGREIRCIVSVGMLTEGWDCNTVTHIVGLRPFMSQLLCEQVVGRGLRRASYELGTDGLPTEEVSKVFGVPFEIVPFKATQGGSLPAHPPRKHVHALATRAKLEIRFPRVEGYRQAIKNRVTVDWDSIAPLVIDPLRIPPEVEMKAGIPNNLGRFSITGPGRIQSLSLNPYRKSLRLQQLAFELAKDLTRDFSGQSQCQVPSQSLFPQILAITLRFIREKLVAHEPADQLDVFLSPYYGWVIERLVAAISPDTAQGEDPELPCFELNREPGSTSEVDYWTSKDVREVVHSHVNFVVADTKIWEQSAAFVIDKHPAVEAFVKNAGLGFAIPYFANGQDHDYIPDFIVRLQGARTRYLVLETKGYDPMAELKAQAAQRWIRAVNASGEYGAWEYRVVRKIEEVGRVLDEFSREFQYTGKA
jgi:type III restriction enzyme